MLTRRHLTNMRRGTRGKLLYKGFSLVELMVTVAIVAILAGVAAPAMQGMIIQSRLSGQTNDLVSAIQFARGEAIKRNQPVRLCRTENSGAAVCSGAGRWENWVVLNSNDTVLRQGSVGDSLRLSSTLGNGTLTFAPNGISNIIANVADTLTLCSPDASSSNTRQIQVGIVGRSTLLKPVPGKGACS